MSTVLPLPEPASRRARGPARRARAAQARQAPAPPGRPRDRRLRHDRGRRQGDGVPVRRQGQLHDARRAAAAAEEGAGAVLADRGEPRPEAARVPGARAAGVPALASASITGSSNRTPIRSSAAWCRKARPCARCARACAAARCTRSPRRTATPRSRSATIATTSSPRSSSTCSSTPSSAGMPPKLLSDDGKHVVIRPLAYVREDDIAAYAQAKRFPIIPCNLCGSQENLQRKQVQRMLDAVGTRIARPHRTDRARAGRHPPVAAGRSEAVRLHGARATRRRRAPGCACVAGRRTRQRATDATHPAHSDRPNAATPIRTPRRRQASATPTPSSRTSGLDVLPQPDPVPLPHFARSLRTRHPPRRIPAQAGRRAGAVLARFRLAVRPRRCRNAVASHRRCDLADRRRRGQAAAGRGGQRPAGEETRRDGGEGRPQARRPRAQAAQGRPGARTAAARLRAAVAHRCDARPRARPVHRRHVVAQERRSRGLGNPPRARQLPGVAAERRSRAALGADRLDRRRAAARRLQPRRGMRAQGRRRARRHRQVPAPGTAVATRSPSTWNPASRSRAWRWCSTTTSRSCSARTW